MRFDINNINIKPLPTQVIIKNFIEGHEIDPEEYLTEFINSSNLVKDKGNKPFDLRPHKCQSSKECDIGNGYYELDFKFLVDSKYMEGKKMLSYTITELFPGAIAIGPQKGRKNQKAFDVIKIFRNKNLYDLKKIEDGTLKIEESSTIKDILKKVSVDKNILFVLSFEYFYENSETNKDIASFILECIGNDLSSLIEYRKEKINKDTFFAFFSTQYFVIAQEMNKSLILYDIIKTSVSDNFTELQDIDNYLI